MKNILIFLLLVFGAKAFAQIDNYPMGGRSFGMGNASVALTDAWGIFNNVAGIAQEEQVQAFIAYDNRFGVAEFQTFGLGSIVPLSFGIAGLGVSRFGDEFYNETRLGLGLAKDLDNVSLGLKVNYVQVSIQELGTKGSIALEFGGLVRITPDLNFGASIYNFNQAKLKSEFDEDTSIPTVMRAGLAFHPIEKLWLSTEIEKATEEEASIRAGVEYAIVKNIYLRTGLQSKPFINYFGFGLQPKSFVLDYALTTSSDLGLSHHVSFGYKF